MSEAKINDKLDELLTKVTRIETALWPDLYQPSVLTRHSTRIHDLENWRNYLTGAWFIVTTMATVIGIKLFGHKG